jgi:hypothetical protein
LTNLLHLSLGHAHPANATSDLSLALVHESAALKWTPSVGPKAGWRKRDACSDFEIIKNTS